LAKYPAGLLALMVEYTEYHIRNLVSFMQRLEITTIRDADILVSFSVVPFFTKISRDDTLQLEEPLKGRILAVFPHTFSSMESSATSRRT
jgi:hypothetical protein